MTHFGDSQKLIRELAICLKYRNETNINLGMYTILALVSILKPAVNKKYLPKMNKIISVYNFRLRKFFTDRKLSIAIPSKLL